MKRRDKNAEKKAAVADLLWAERNAGLTSALTAEIDSQRDAARTQYNSFVQRATVLLGTSLTLLAATTVGAVSGASQSGSLLDWRYLVVATAILTNALVPVFTIKVLLSHRLLEFNVEDVQLKNDSSPEVLALYYVKESKRHVLNHARQEVLRVSKWLDRAYVTLIFALPLTITTTLLEILK